MKSTAGLVSRSLLAATALWTPLIAAQDGPGFVQGLVNQFENSDIVFQRSTSNVPFAPVAFLGGKSYGSTEVENSNRGTKLKYDVTSVSQAAGLPIVIGSRDALIIGEYLSRSEFDVHGDTTESFNVSSVGLPIAWLRQINDDWQVGAFVMPLGHNTSLPDGDWTWQTLGGVISRYVQNDRLWWAFGFYADVAPGDDFYIPYVGASWSINDRWTVSAVMPWPSVIYAPTPDLMFRLGASPSGASWSVQPDQGDVSVNLDAWDFGLSAEHRITGNFWASLEVGAGGFRGLRFEGASVEEPEIELDSGGYIGFDISYRPAIR
tara:strand:- start:228168 stop:229127 length:960 start_codon:yes stop_codon:yes gene_type:complete